MGGGVGEIAVGTAAGVDGLDDLEGLRVEHGDGNAGGEAVVEGVVDGCAVGGAVGTSPRGARVSRL